MYNINIISNSTAVNITITTTAIIIDSFAFGSVVSNIEGGGGCIFIIVTIILTRLRLGTSSTTANTILHHYLALLGHIL